MLVSAIYNMKELNKLNGLIDGAVLNTKDYSLIYDNLDLDLAYSFCLNNKILPIISLNKMFYPNELDNIKDIYLKYDKALFLITDLGLYHIAKGLNLENKLIYNPETMLTNYLDLKLYSSLGFNALAMSLEIPFKDVIYAKEETNADLFYMVFGKRMMLYSRRKLLSLYKEKANINLPNSTMYLKEVNREDYFPIIENENGTKIFRSYIVSYLDLLDKDYFKYNYLDSFDIDFDIFKKVVTIYKNYLDKKIDKEEAIKNLNELNLNIEDGFKYKDSVYQKEEF